MIRSPVPSRENTVSVLEYITSLLFGQTRTCAMRDGGDNAWGHNGAVRQDVEIDDGCAWVPDHALEVEEYRYRCISAGPCFCVLRRVRGGATHNMLPRAVLIHTRGIAPRAEAIGEDSRDSAELRQVHQAFE